MSDQIRPPHTQNQISRLIRRNKFDQARKYCDDNVEFYRRRIQDMQDLYVRACRQAG